MTATAERVALIVGAGSGERVGGVMPKQYRSIAGVPLLLRTIRAFLAHPQIDTVHVVINPSHGRHYQHTVAGMSLPDPVAGGADRQTSVRRGLERLVDIAPRFVLIHDAARPFVDAETISRVVQALDQEPAAIAATPVTDTLKRARDGHIAATVPRAQLWRAQTPQGFDFNAILAAHRQFADQVLTDDAAVAERAGIPVRLVLGNEENFKVTTEFDFVRAESQAARHDGAVRVGHGFDVHRFGPGDAVILCGITIPHTHRLVGHSDGDVGLHALVDALLGALGAGDIGHHFPPTDPRWRGADSRHFLGAARGLVADAGGRISHVDVTLICEAPKIGPHRDAMVAQVAEILRLAKDRVSIKATTTEKLGFTGRGEGIAAQATATVIAP